MSCLFGWQADVNLLQSCQNGKEFCSGKTTGSLKLSAWNTMTLHLSATHVKTEFTWCSEKLNSFLVCFCLVVACGMSVLKILCLIMVDAIHNMYCNVSRNTFYLLYFKVFFAQIFTVLSLHGLPFHCSLCGAYLQVKVVLGKIPPLPPLFSPCNKNKPIQILVQERHLKLLAFALCDCIALNHFMLGICQHFSHDHVYTSCYALLHTRRL